MVPTDGTGPCRASGGRRRIWSGLLGVSSVRFAGLLVCWFAGFCGVRRVWRGDSGDSSPLVSPGGLRRASSLTSLRRVPRFTTPGLYGPAFNIRWGKASAVFNGLLASSGHRGRDDARGQRSGGELGLTRTL